MAIGRRRDRVAKPAAGARVSVVFFDAFRVKIRDEATVRSKAVYLTLAVLPDGSPRHPGRDLHHQRLGERARSLCNITAAWWKAANLLAHAMNQFADCLPRIASLHRGVKGSEHGRCHHCERSEAQARAHNDLANRRTWFPTAPTGINRLSGEEKRHLTHRISDTPDIRIGVRNHRFHVSDP